VAQRVLCRPCMTCMRRMTCTTRTKTSLVRNVVTLGLAAGAAVMLLAGCGAETAEGEGEDEEVGTSEDALGGLGPCPVCTSPGGCITGACIGTKRGTTGCKEGAVTTKTTQVTPEKWLVSSTCEDWWDRTSGEGAIYSRTCTQRAYRTLFELGVCKPNKVGTGPYVTQWHYTVNGGERVKRTRSQVTFQVVNPITSSSPWTPWNKE
jgi:hypothetical protein